jgi:hypothetical protein
MESVHRTRTGIQAGLLGGSAVVLLFFLLDLFRLQPLSTPIALGNSILMPGGFLLDTPVISQVVSLVMFAGSILTLTILHFLAFSCLGLGAVWGCEECGVKLNVLSGALFGITVGSLLFYGSLSLGGDQILANLPGPVSVLLANLMAGAVMGGFVQMKRRA